MFLSPMGWHARTSVANSMGAIHVHRAGRIYPTFVLAVAAHLLFVVTLWNEHLLCFSKRMHFIKHAVAFVPNAQLRSGPWWFFSFIFQFYAVFRAVEPVGGAVWAAAFWLSPRRTRDYDVANPYLIPHGLNLYFTVLGHLPVLCLGIYMARADKLSVDHRVVLAAALIFVLGNWFVALWYLAPICVTLLLIASLPRVIERLRAWPRAYRFVRYAGLFRCRCSQSM